MFSRLFGIGKGDAAGSPDAFELGGHPAIMTQKALRRRAEAVAGPKSSGVDVAGRDAPLHPTHVGPMARHCSSHGLRPTALSALCVSDDSRLALVTSEDGGASLHATTPPFEATPLACVAGRREWIAAAFVPETTCVVLAAPDAVLVCDAHTQRRVFSHALADEEFSAGGGVARSPVVIAPIAGAKAAAIVGVTARRGLHLRIVAQKPALSAAAGTATFADPLAMQGGDSADKAQWAIASPSSSSDSVGDQDGAVDLDGTVTRVDSLRCLQHPTDPDLLLVAYQTAAAAAVGSYPTKVLAVSVSERAVVGRLVSPPLSATRPFAMRTALRPVGQWAPTLATTNEPTNDAPPTAPISVGAGHVAVSVEAPGGTGLVGWGHGPTAALGKARRDKAAAADSGAAAAPFEQQPTWVASVDADALFAAKAEEPSHIAVLDAVRVEPTDTAAFAAAASDSAGGVATAVGGGPATLFALCLCTWPVAGATDGTTTTETALGSSSVTTSGSPTVHYAMREAECARQELLLCRVPCLPLSSQGQIDHAAAAASPPVILDRTTTFEAAPDGATDGQGQHAAGVFIDPANAQEAVVPFAVPKEGAALLPSPRATIAAHRAVVLRTTPFATHVIDFAAPLLLPNTVAAQAEVPSDDCVDAGTEEAPAARSAITLSPMAPLAACSARSSVLKWAPKASGSDGLVLAAGDGDLLEADLATSGFAPRSRGPVHDADEDVCPPQWDGQQLMLVTTATAAPRHTLRCDASGDGLDLRTTVSVQITGGPEGDEPATVVLLEPGVLPPAEVTAVLQLTPLNAEAAAAAWAPSGDGGKRSPGPKGAPCLVLFALRGLGVVTVDIAARAIVKHTALPTLIPERLRGAMLTAAVERTTAGDDTPSASLTKEAADTEDPSSVDAPVDVETATEPATQVTTPAPPRMAALTPVATALRLVDLVTGRAAPSSEDPASTVVSLLLSSEARDAEAVTLPSPVVVFAPLGAFLPPGFLYTLKDGATKERPKDSPSQPLSLGALLLGLPPRAAPATPQTPPGVTTAASAVPPDVAPPPKRRPQPSVRDVLFAGPVGIHGRPNPFRGTATASGGGTGPFTPQLFAVVFRAEERHPARDGSGDQPYATATTRVALFSPLTGQRLATTVIPVGAHGPGAAVTMRQGAALGTLRAAAVAAFANLPGPNGAAPSLHLLVQLCRPASDRRAQHGLAPAVSTTHIVFPLLPPTTSAPALGAGSVVEDRAPPLHWNAVDSASPGWALWGSLTQQALPRLARGLATNPSIAPLLPPGHEGPATPWTLATWAEAVDAKSPAAVVPPSKHHSPLYTAGSQEGSPASAEDGEKKKSKGLFSRIAAKVAGPAQAAAAVPTVTLAEQQARVRVALLPTPAVPKPEPAPAAPATAASTAATTAPPSLLSRSSNVPAPPPAPTAAASAEPAKDDEDFDAFIHRVAAAAPPKERDELLARTERRPGAAPPSGKAGAMSDDLTGTKRAMTEASERLAERGDKLKELGEKTGEMQTSASSFADLAKQYKQQNSSWW